MCMHFIGVENHKAFPKPKIDLHQNRIRSIALDTVLVNKLLKIS